MCIRPVKVKNKNNMKLKFVNRKSKFITPQLRRMFCNALIEPCFAYACPALYPHLTKKYKSCKVNAYGFALDTIK